MGTLAASSSRLLLHIIRIAHPCACNDIRQACVVRSGGVLACMPCRLHICGIGTSQLRRPIDRHHHVARQLLLRGLRRKGMIGVCITWLRCSLAGR